MIVYKAFKSTELIQGGKKFRMNERATTDKPCILRVSGLHACNTVETVKKYYPEHPVIVACDVDPVDVVDQHDGALVAKALTPREFVSGMEQSNNEDFEEEQNDDLRYTAKQNLADRLSSLSNNLHELFVEVRQIADDLEDL